MSSVAVLCIMHLIPEANSTRGVRHGTSRDGTIQICYCCVIFASAATHRHALAHHLQAEEDIGTMADERAILKSLGLTDQRIEQTLTNAKITATLLDLCNQVCMSV